jgi:hypothetical protein
MGYNGWPIYGEDIGSAIEDLEKVIGLIKTNKFSKNDLIKICEINTAIIKYVINED